MLSRWQEAAANRKYDYVLNDVRNLKQEMAITEARLTSEEDARQEAEKGLAEKALLNEQLKKEINEKSVGGQRFDKLEEVTKNIKEIADEKTELEELYIKAYAEVSKYRSLTVEAQAWMEAAEEIVNTIKNSTDSEISGRIVKMSDKLKNARISELSSKRESEEYRAKQEYQERRLGEQKRNIIDLEHRLAESESLFHRKEEEWKRWDNQRQREFFDVKFNEYGAKQRLQPKPGMGTLEF